MNSHRFYKSTLLCSNITASNVPYCILCSRIACSGMGTYCTTVSSSYCTPLISSLLYIDVSRHLPEFISLSYRGQWISWNQTSSSKSAGVGRRRLVVGGLTEFHQPVKLGWSVSAWSRDGGYVIVIEKKDSSLDWDGLRRCVFVQITFHPFE